MRVTWQRSFPRWAGIACLAFGVANIVGALVSASELTLPGIVIGGVWAIVGFQGGLPLFESCSTSTADPITKLAEGLRTLRRRRRAAFIAAGVWLAVAAIVLPRVPSHFIGTVFFLTAVPVVAIAIVWGLSACPRCRRYFLPVLQLRLRVSMSHCQNCGQALRGA